MTLHSAQRLEKLWGRTCLAAVVIAGILGFTGQYRIGYITIALGVLSAARYSHWRGWINGHKAAREARNA